jgi:hypothetical protein
MIRGVGLCSADLHFLAEHHPDVQRTLVQLVVEGKAKDTRAAAKLLGHPPNVALHVEVSPAITDAIDALVRRWQPANDFRLSRSAVVRELLREALEVEGVLPPSR